MAGNSCKTFDVVILKEKNFEKYIHLITESVTSHIFNGVIITFNLNFNLFETVPIVFAL